MVLLENVIDTSAANWRVLTRARSFYLEMSRNVWGRNPNTRFILESRVVYVHRVTWAPFSQRIIHHPVNGDLTLGRARC